jgi:hypothetical protein
LVEGVGRAAAALESAPSSRSPQHHPQAAGDTSRQRRVTKQEAAEGLRALDFDLAAGDYVAANLAWLDVLRQAESLSAKHAVQTQCRAMDLWHCAAALDDDCDLFLSFDETQRCLAEAAGLTVWRP